MPPANRPTLRISSGSADSNFRISQRICYIPHDERSQLVLVIGARRGELNPHALSACEIKKSHEDAKTSTENSIRVLSTLQNMSNTVASIHRLMSPLTGAAVNVSYSLDCALRKISPCGESLAQEEIVLATSGVSFYFFAHPVVARRDIDGAWHTALPDFQWTLTRNENADQAGSFGEGGSANSLNVTIPGYAAEPTYLH